MFRSSRTTSDDDQIIIQITKVPQRGGHMPLSSETLKTRFFKNCSKKGQSWTGPCRFVQIGTTFGLTFLNTFENHFLTCVASPVKKWSEPVILCAIVLASFPKMGGFAPLPCTVYLVISQMSFRWIIDFEDHC